MDWRRARPLGALLGVTLSLLFVLALFAAFYLLVQFITADQDATAIGRLGAGTLIVALLSAPFLIWRTVISHRTLGFQREGHITDRISQAVEQLGADKTTKISSSLVDGGFLTREETEPNIEVRIGGILSLERIAQDSVLYDNGRDQVRVMEILCAYIRQNSKVGSATRFPLPDWERLDENPSQGEREDLENWMSARFGGAIMPEPNAREWSRTLPPLREDVAIALTVIGRRNDLQMAAEARWGRYVSDDTNQPLLPPEPPGPFADDRETLLYIEKLKAWASENRGYRGYRLDLTNCNLQNAQLGGLSLPRVDFSDSALDGADFYAARLEGARFHRCKMRGVSLMGAHLEDTNFEHANLEAAYISSAHLSMAYLNWARLDAATMFNVNLHMTLIQGASLNRTELILAQMYQTSFLNTDLHSSQLNRASLYGSDFGGARLDGCSLLAVEIDSNTVFESASFKGAAFLKADLEHTSITNEMFAEAFGDLTVRLPQSSQRPDHWPAWPLKDSFHGDWARWRVAPSDFLPTPEDQCGDRSEVDRDEGSPKMRTVFRATP